MSEYAIGKWVLSHRGRMLGAAVWVTAIGVGVLVGCSKSIEPPTAVQDVAIPLPDELPGGLKPNLDAPQWLLVGGGAYPELNQISLEEDLRELGALLPDNTITLFAGGAGTTGVQVLREHPPADPLLQELGALFAPRGGRDSTYRAVRGQRAGPATRDQFVTSWNGVLRHSKRPSLFVATHGEGGEVLGDSRILLWGDGGFSVQELVKVMDDSGHDVPVRTIITGCYGGGFSELLFEQGDASKGPSEVTRCGLFASTWDRVSSGCDPNPLRREHQGYGVHFISAIRGSNREGKALSKEELDVDGDGVISLLDAHTYVRRESVSLDVPTSTSERWLASQGFPMKPMTVREVKDPHEKSVLMALSNESLSLNKAKKMAEAAEAELQSMDERLKNAEEGEMAAYRLAAVELLEKWPVLDDPWHPEFWTSFQTNREAISLHLRESKMYAQYETAMMRRNEVMMAWEQLMVSSARVFRIHRALEHASRLDALQDSTPEIKRIYKALRDCENSAL